MANLAPLSFSPDEDGDTARVAGVAQNELRSSLDARHGCRFKLAHATGLKVCWLRADGPHSGLSTAAWTAPPSNQVENARDWIAPF